MNSKQQPAAASASEFISVLKFSQMTARNPMGKILAIAIIILGDILRYLRYFVDMTAVLVVLAVNCGNSR